MATQTFKAFISTERKRLTKHRSDVLKRKAALDDEFEQIETEFKAIAAYETAKTGKVARTRKRRTGRRAEILDAIKKHPKGIGRGDLIKFFGVTGNKSDVQSISNALTGLKKTGRVDHKDGKYIAVR